MSQTKAKFFTSLTLSLFLLSQILFISSGLLIPKKVEAQAAAALGTVPTADMPTVWERIIIGVARGILQKFTESFLNKFTNQLVSKYKIRNYLYYDRVLTNYYLNRYIADNITDPDLKNIYTLLERGYVSGASTGTTGGPDPAAALIPRLNKAINDYYLKQGGIDSNKIYNPSPNVTDREYFATAQAYFSNPQGFTEQNLRGQFGAFQSSATTASQLEVLVGNGLKAGRIIGGTCSVNIPNPTPETCQAAGGTWQASALDQARSFIENPSGYVDKMLLSSVSQHFSNLYNPSTDFWTQIGKSFGRFIWNQLALDKSGGTLSDDPRGYTPLGFDGVVPPPSTPGTCELDPDQVDIDADCIADGYDYTGDGVIDICNFGGSPPNGCVGSKTIISPPPPSEEGPTCEDIPTGIACTTADQTELVRQVKSYVVGRGQQFNSMCDAFEIVKRVAWALRSTGGGLVFTFHSSRCPDNGFSGDLIGYPDGSMADILGSAGGPPPPPEQDSPRNIPQWLPFPPNPNPEQGVGYAPAIDPGDPADACYFTLTCP